MGLFEGEDVYAFEIATAKMVNTDIDPMMDAILTAILTDGDISSYILATALNSIAFKAKKYLKYGQDKYIYGLPEADWATIAVDNDKVADAIAIEQGEPVTVLSGFVGAPEINYFAYEYLQNTFGYRTKTNELTISSIIFEVIEITDNTISTPYYYFPPTSILINIIEKNAFPGPPIELTLRIDFPEKSLYYQAIFHLDSELEDDLQFWTYDSDLGTYPDLTIDTTTVESTYYPIAPIRVDKDWLEEDPDIPDEEDPYTNVKRLLKRITVPFEDVVDAIEEEQDDDEVEDLNDIFYVFGVDIYTDVEESFEYIYRFFDKLSESSPVTKAVYEAAVAIIDTTNERPPVNAFRVTEEQFSSVLEYNYITKTVITGELETEYEKEIFYEKSTRVEIEYILYDVDGQPITMYYTIKLQTSHIIARRDNKDGTYTEILMHGPRHITRIKALGKEKNVYRSIDEDFIRPDDTDPDDWDKYGQSGFFFLIDFQIMEQLSIQDQMYALMDAMLLVIYAATKDHLEWYETGVFRALLQFVMIVINVILFIPTLGSSLKLSAVLWKLFLALAAPLLMSYVFELLVKTFGKDFALVVAALFIAYGALKGMGLSLKSLPNALDLLTMTKAITKGVKAFNEFNSYAMTAEGIETDIDMEVAEDELDELEALLNQDGYSPQYAIEAMIHMDAREEPDEYYARTIHWGNPGVSSLDMIGNYHERALALPRIGEVGLSIVV